MNSLSKSASNLVKKLQPLLSENNIQRYMAHNIESFAEVSEVKTRAVMELNAVNVIKSSRMIGVYEHYGEYMLVYNAANGMKWSYTVESVAREVLQYRIYKSSLSHGILLIQDSMVAAKIIEPLTKSSISLDVCRFTSLVVFEVSIAGIEQLRLFRSYPNVQEKYIEATLEDSERVCASNCMDGKQNGVDTVVLFECELFKVRTLIALVSLGHVHRLRIICYDTQATLYRKLFAACQELEIVTYSVDEVMTALTTP